MNYCFGVDIGGTTIKMGIFKFDGESVDKWEIKTRTENKGSAILPDVAYSVAEKFKRTCNSERSCFRNWCGSTGTGIRRWNCQWHSKPRMGI